MQAAGVEGGEIKILGNIFTNVIFINESPSD